VLSFALTLVANGVMLQRCSLKPSHGHHREPSHELGGCITQRPCPIPAMHMQRSGQIVSHVAAVWRHLPWCSWMSSAQGFSPECTKQQEEHPLINPGLVCVKDVFFFFFFLPKGILKYIV
jgi:hypothetical protein